MATLGRNTIFETSPFTCAYFHQPRTFVLQQIVTPDKRHIQPVNINYQSIRPSTVKLNTANRNRATGANVAIR